MRDTVSQAFIEQAKHHLSRDFLPKLAQAVPQLSARQLWWRPNENSNSVGNLLLHLEGNVRQWIIAGLGKQPDRRRRDEEFSHRGLLPAEDLMRNLEKTVGEALQVLDGLSTRDLLEKRPVQVYQVTGLQAVFHVVEHFSYHVGQILYIVKSLRDMDLKFYEL